MGTYFVGQYYQMLQTQPDYVHQFYSDASTMLRIDGNTRETASAMLVFFMDPVSYSFWSLNPQKIKMHWTVLEEYLLGHWIFNIIQREKLIELEAIYILNTWCDYSYVLFFGRISFCSWPVHRLCCEYYIYSFPWLDYFHVILSNHCWHSIFVLIHHDKRPYCTESS